jgi:hypothetical protein
LLFNKIGEEGRTGSAWKLWGWVEGDLQGAGGRGGSNNVFTYK